MVAKSLSFLLAVATRLASILAGLLANRLDTILAGFWQDFGKVAKGGGKGDGLENSGTG